MELCRAFETRWPLICGGNIKSISRGVKGCLLTLAVSIVAAPIATSLATMRAMNERDESDEQRGYDS